MGGYSHKNFPSSILLMTLLQPKWKIIAVVFEIYYHASNSHECMGVNGEALQLHSVYKKPYFFLLQVTRESVSVLQVMQKSVSVLHVHVQVTWKSVSGTASHGRCVWTCNEIEGLYDKIIITIVPGYTGKISLVCCCWHCWHYSCCTLITIQMATNSWYFSVYM